MTVAASAHHLVIKPRAFVMGIARKGIMETFVKYLVAPFVRMILVIRSPVPAVRDVKRDITEPIVTKPVVYVTMPDVTTVQVHA